MPLNGSYFDNYLSFYKFIVTSLLNGYFDETKY